MTINWQEVIIAIGSTVGGGAVLLSAAAWLIKTALTSKLTRDTEEFKAQLQKIAVEHQVRFSKLHEKRAEVIADLYERLVKDQWAARLFVLNSEYSDPNQEKLFRTMQQELGDLNLFFDTHRIYLPDSVCTSLDEFLYEVQEKVLTAGLFGPIQPTDEAASRQKRETFKKAYEDFRTGIPAARAALEKEFRTILGS
jgi:hypothetical protein